MTTNDYQWLLTTTRWLSDDYPMTIQWLSDDYPMTIRWLSDDYPMTIRLLSDDYPMTITNFLSIFLDDHWSIDWRWLFKSGATFILRWSCCPVKVVTRSENVTPITWVVSPNFWVRRCRCLGSESRGNNRVWKLVRRWWLNQRSNCAQSRLPNWT